MSIDALDVDVLIMLTRDVDVYACIHSRVHWLK